MTDQISSASAPDHFRDLEKDLAAACNELEEYQRLIDELPQIYEAKFGSQVHALAQEIRHLTEERHRLQLQIQHCIQAEAVLPPPSASPAEFRPGFRQRFRRSAPWSLPIAIAAASLAMAVALGLAWRALQGRPTTSRPPALPPQAQPARPATPRPAPLELRLRARDQVWLELRSADNSLLFVGTMQPGQTHAVPLADGLRLRSGRPHQLDVAVGDQPFAPFGALNDYSWHTISTRRSDQPPVFRPEGADRPS